VSETPGRILALDLGERRLGLAISDGLGVTAQPVEKLQSLGRARDVRQVRDIVEQRDVVKVLIGDPLHLSGAIGARAEHARRFAASLAAVLPGVEVELWDERLTTAQIEREMIAGNVSRRRRREVVDSLAAVLILQSYLDARSARGTP
jgi:putative Holliday junction resolvase